jgi:hypothetical protein
MSDDAGDFGAGAGDPPTRQLESTCGRWPTLVCDGWITPNHPRRVLRASGPGAGISFGMCPICATTMIAALTRRLSSG